MKIKALSVIAALGLAGTLSAHSYIFEPVDGKVSIYHTDYSEKYREHKITKWERYEGLRASARVRGKVEALEAKKEDGHLSVALPEGVEGFWFDNLKRPVGDWRKFGKGIVKPFEYARLLMSTPQSKPDMDLDLLPAKGKPGFYRVYFKGKPLEKAEVTIEAPNFWIQKKRSDKEGLIEVLTPWEGLYVMELNHSVPVPDGKHEGIFYDADFHNGSFCLRVKKQP